jgi:Tol biopolymer transport system component
MEGKDMKSFTLRAGLTGVVITATALFASPAWATFPGTNGQITFAALPTPDAPGKQIFTIEPNGTSLRQLTQLAGDANTPHWSPDGTRIAFELDHPTGEPLCSVMLMNADGSGLTDLTGNRNGCEAAPSFTPDGSRIVFERFDDITNVDAIWSMNLSGGDRHLITTGTGSGVTNPEVSPDGTTLSFVDFNGQDFGQALFTAHIDGTSLRQLTPFALDVGIKQSWAPDGSRITLTPHANFDDHSSPNVATINPDGSELRYLTHYNAGGAAAFTGSYSPDRQWIVFRLQSKSTSTFGLFKMRPDGTQRTLIAELPFAPRGSDWGTHP